MFMEGLNGQGWLAVRKFERSDVDAQMIMKLTHLGDNTASTGLRSPCEFGLIPWLERMGVQSQAPGTPCSIARAHTTTQGWKGFYWL